MISTVNLFGPSTEDDIKVGYISTTRGYITGVGIRDANKYAKKDPGTKFILQNRDYIKYLKRGYSRVTQIVNFEIRKGRMTAEEGKKLIDKYDGNKPQSLDLFLEYMGINEADFNSIVKKQVIPPNDPDFENIKIGKKMKDMDQWYREDNS